jgi:hypothetical protein
VPSNRRALTSNDGIPNCHPSLFPLDGCWEQEALHRVHQGIYQEQPSRLEAEESGRTICDLCQEIGGVELGRRTA